LEKGACLRKNREENFLLNPRHADFARIRIGTPETLDTDSRLVRQI
jgi:hypothetical protein